MRYDEERKTMTVTASELVRLARRRSTAGTNSEREENAPFLSEELLRMLPEMPTVLHGSYQVGDLLFEVTAEAAITGDRVTVAAVVAGDPAKPPADIVRQARGEAFCAAYLFSKACDTENPEIAVRYISRTYPEPYEVTERPSAASLARFFERLFSGMQEESRAELDRVVRRLPTMKRVRFPFSEVREGQRDLISACYRAIRRGERLYASAPTGIGKTVSVLFPAVRALGAGHCDKIFYLTPKNTAALAAAEAAKKLAASGAELRVLLLTAKERICPNGLLCRNPGGERCTLSRLAPTREDEAARDLLAMGETVVDAARLIALGQERRVCPYELSLRYAMLADIVICDYNYLFDLRVALHRFFDRAGNWCFLIDEAHNLVERSRELYSGEISSSFFDRFRPAGEKTPALAAAICDAVLSFRDILTPYVADSIRLDADGVRRGFAENRELPVGLPEALGSLLTATEATLSERKLPPDLQTDLTSAYYDLSHLLQKLSLYSDRFTSFIRSENGCLTYRAFCLDPSEIIAERLSHGASAVLFSATLTPTDYYRTVLGGGANSEILDLPSPFDPSRLCVAVMDRIGTRYHEREETMKSVARAILTAIRCRPGNYLVFCPSFAYLRALETSVGRLAPRLATVRQEPHMSSAARRAFLDRFSEENRQALLGFCVLGGIYSEGVDLVGKRLIGSVIIGVGLPQPSPEREAISAYYEETLESGREYAYVYPGMNRVLQAAGRVIRREEDTGIILFIDDRFSEPVYRELIPAHWRGLKYVGDLPSLDTFLRRFWEKNK